MKKELMQIALPITIQSLFQASMSVVDQIMTGRLGEVSVAGIGLGGKFSSLYSVILAAVATAAGILISQYAGSRDWEGMSKNFWMGLGSAGVIAAAFSVIGLAGAGKVMGIYSTDQATVAAAADYLRITAIGFVPMAVTLLLTTLHRSVGLAKIPLYASLASVCINTFLNYLLIFGKLGMPKLGLTGAAWATTIARLAELLLVLLFTVYLIAHQKIRLVSETRYRKRECRMFVSVLGPILLCEALWSLGENIYAVIYGRMGTAECAAMTLTGPIQSLMIGAMTGIAAASGIMVGKRLGEGDEEEAYKLGKQFLWYGFAGTLLFAAVLFIGRRYYIQLFNVTPAVKEMTVQLLTAYAAVIVVKVENMILGGGIIRSGGKTKLVLMVDTIGTWGIGIPLGLLAAFIWKLPVVWVYFILSQEECARLLISAVVFKKRIWMQNLTQKVSRV